MSVIKQKNPGTINSGTESFSVGKRCLSLFCPVIAGVFCIVLKCFLNIGEAVSEVRVSSSDYQQVNVSLIDHVDRRAILVVMIYYDSNFHVFSVGQNPRNIQLTVLNSNGEVILNTKDKKAVNDNFSQIQKNAQGTEAILTDIERCERNKEIINYMVERYSNLEGTWPMDDLSDIGSNYYYFPDGMPTCPVDGSKYMLLPSPYHRVSGHRLGIGTHINGALTEFDLLSGKEKLETLINHPFSEVLVKLPELFFCINADDGHYCQNNTATYSDEFIAFFNKEWVLERVISDENEIEKKYRYAMDGVLDKLYSIPITPLVHMLPGP